MSVQEENLEKSLKGYPDIVTLEKTETIVKQIKNCIFRIHITECNGTGFFCLISDEKKQEKMKVMITNNHVIGDDYLKTNKTIKISLNNNKKIMDIKLDSSRKKYTSKQYDATIIEIKEEDKVSDNSFLNIDEQIYQDNPSAFFAKKTVYVIQYPNYLNASVSYGLIKGINEDSDLEHLCITNKGSSGSPIINLENNEVIGIHKKGSPDKFNYNIGTFLNNPIKDFFLNPEKNMNSNNQNNNDKPPLLQEIDKLINSYNKHLLKDYNILLLGLDNSGKTALLNYLLGEDNKNTRTTPGVNAKKLSYEEINFNLYDLGGQRAIREYWKFFYYEIDAIIYVVDASDEGRIEECHEILHEIIKDECLLNVPILFLGNKTDLSDCLKGKKIIEKLKLDDINGRIWSYCSCSALKGKGVKHGINWLLKNLLK